MTAAAGKSESIFPLSLLLRAEPAMLGSWLEAAQGRWVAFCLAAIVVGTGLYGAAMGCWRAPLQGVFVALKLPLIVLLTSFGNAVLNGMLAPLLGVNIGLRQTFLGVLMSFTIAAAILGAFSPVVAFMVWNAPPMSSPPGSLRGAYTLILLAHVLIIAFAGVTGNVRLLRLLEQFGGPAKARRVLVAWLAGNFLLGSQLSWILRPFIGSPDLRVEFLRATAFQGNFYECVWQALTWVFTGHH
jgi:hypothetical protein